MKFRILAIGITLCCCLLDVVGIVTTLWFNEFVGGATNITQISQLEEITQDGRHLVISDFSVFRNVPIVIYTLPYIFSGVLPRMLNGFKCMRADQEVLDTLLEWNKAVDQVREHGKDDFSVIVDAFAPANWQANVINETNIKLGKVLQRRRIVCSDISFQNFKTAIPLLQIEGKLIDPNFDEIQEFQDDYNSFHVMFMAQMLVMGGNALVSLVLVFIMIFDFDVSYILYIPWLLINALEIAGNICVGVAFLIYPGKCQLTSLVCFVRVLWLKWVFVNIVRKHMNMPRQQESSDLERLLLRSLLDQKGKIRLM